MGTIKVWTVGTPSTSLSNDRATVVEWQPATDQQQPPRNSGGSAQASTIVRMSQSTTWRKLKRYYEGWVRNSNLEGTQLDAFIVSLAQTYETLSEVDQYNIYERLEEGR